MHHKAGACSQSAATKTVYIIEDDASVRTAFERLIVSAGFATRTFASANAFLDAEVPHDGACILCDIRMQGLSGLELARKLKQLGSQPVIVFVTAFDSEEFRREAQRAGALAYYRKPVDDQALLDSIEWAFNQASRDE